MNKNYKFKIKNCFGFTLVELLVVIGVVGVMIGGTVVYINRSRSREKLAATKNELVANLRMARNYARTLQTPAGYTGSLEYVEVTLAGNGLMTVYPLPLSGEGMNYFAKDISPQGVGVSMTAGQLTFAAYEGKLFVGGAPMGPSERVAIIISSSEGVGETEVIEVNSAGLIDEKPARSESS